MKTPRLWRYLWPVLILWLAFSLRLYQLDFQSIWWDEGHSIFVASHSISQIPTLPAMDVHPPGYFILLHLWMALAGRSEFVLRYLSVFFSLLTVALLWRFTTSLSRQLFPARPYMYTSLLSCSLASLSPMYIAYSQEVRSYAMITFLALGSTFTLWQIIFRKDKTIEKNSSLTWFLFYILLTAACLYTHYFTIFLLLFQNLVWLVWIFIPLQNSKDYTRNTPQNHTHFWIDRLPRLRVWVLSQTGILFLFIPQLTLALRQVASYTNPNLIPPTLAYFVSRSWQAYTVGLTINSSLGQWGWGIAGVLIAGWFIQMISVRLKKNHTPQFFASVAFLTLWPLIPLTAYFVVLQRQPSFEPRYLMLITPALFLLLALGLSHAPHIMHYASRITLYALLPIPFFIFITGLYHYYTNETYFKDDSAGVANWLAAQTTPNDIIYIDVPHPFHYYAEQRNIPAPTRYLFVDIHTAADILTQEATGRDRLFWVTWWGSDTDPRDVIPFLAQKAGLLGGQQDFKGYHIQWFNLPTKSKTTFSLPNTLTPINATFGDVLRLDGLALGGVQNGTTTPANKPVWATLHFTLLRQTVVNYKVSLRLRDTKSQITAQLDRDLLNDRHFRTSAWPLTDPALNQAINVYTLPLPPDTLPGSYQLEAVVYNANPPYPGEGVTGHQSADGVAAILGQVIVSN